MLNHIPPTPYIIATAIVIFFGIGLHEYAHCKFADMAGDPTARIQGRVTLNLFKHFEPVGTLMIILSSLSGYGIGWGKPAPLNPARMRNPRVDTFVAVIAGPICNLLQAAVWAVIFRFALGSVYVPADASIFDWPFPIVLPFLGVMINVALAIFNLTPLGILDGHWLVGLALPPKQRDKWFWWQHRYGMMVLIVFVIFSQTPLAGQMPYLDLFGHYIFPIAMKLTSALTGLPIS